MDKNLDTLVEEVTVLARNIARNSSRLDIFLTKSSFERILKQVQEDVEKLDKAVEELKALKIGE